MKKFTDIISRRIKKLFAGNVKKIEESNHPKLDIREEYANAFRTESYVEFWERVMELSSSQASVNGSTTAARLSSYRLFVDQLLDPDEPTVFQTLSLMPSRRTTSQSNLLLDYFAETANAFHIFSQLLKNLDHIRIKYKPLKLIFDSAQIIDLSLINPLIVPVLFPDTSGIKTVQAKCSDLLTQLESSRETTQAKLRLVSKLKLVLASFKLVSSNKKKLSKWISQLDAAAKGTYIIIRDLDTVPRLVARLIDELEYMQTMIEMLAKNGDQERLQGGCGGGEVVRQLKINYVRFCEQMDELEEHLYLCLMTVNRARNLLFKELLEITRK